MFCVRTIKEGQFHVEHSKKNIEGAITGYAFSESTKHTKISFLLDSGTTANWIRKNTFKKIMQFQTKHNLGMNILKANSISQTGNGTVKPKWQIQLSLQFDCKSIKDTVTLCVLPNEEVNLLGQEYMMKNNASIVYN